MAPAMDFESSEIRRVGITPSGLPANVSEPQIVVRELPVGASEANSNALRPAAAPLVDQHTGQISTVRTSPGLMTFPAPVVRRRPEALLKAQSSAVQARE